MANDDSDDDCEYFLQPVSNQYNITDKIIEANQQLYSAGESTRKTQPKVRFRDQKLVDYESEGMDKESSDDGYIDEATTSIEEVVEFEDVCETIEQLDDASGNVDKETLTVENYSQEDFNEDEDNVERSTLDDTLADQTSIDTQVEKLTRPEKSMKQKILRSKSSKVNPSGEPKELDEKKSRKMCCQFKGTDEYKQKLPKYNGFNSHYGLSKEEFAKRELVQRKQSQYREFKQMQQAEHKEFLAGINEEAFAKWLARKMCNTVDKSNPINQFDVSTKSSARKRQKHPQRVAQHESTEL